MHKNKENFNENNFKKEEISDNKILIIDPDREKDNIIINLEQNLNKNIIDQDMNNKNKEKDFKEKEKDLKKNKNKEQSSNNNSIKIPITKKDSLESIYPIRESRLIIKELTKEQIEQNLKENIIYQSLKVRFLEYSAAIKYFRDHYLSKLENDAMYKAHLCQKYIKALENGYDIDEEKIPLGINPDYINDCTKKERIDKYTKLIKEFNKNKIDFTNKRNKILKDFNEMAKKDQIRKVIK
jgi:hypothetical protein